MLIHFLGAKAEVWMLSETSRDTKCYPAHTISQKLEPEVVENLLGFHAVTGCDTVSSFAGCGKKSCWLVFLQHPELLRGVGRDGTVAEVEQFVCHLYGAPDVTGGCDEARRAIFELGKKSLELLPLPLMPLNFTCREPISKLKYGFRQTDVTCHWEIQQIQDGRKQMVS